MRKNLYESNHSNIAYDYRIIIIIREYEIFTEYKIHMIVCLEPSRGIDRRMLIRTQFLQHIVYKY